MVNDHELINSLFVFLTSLLLFLQKHFTSLEDYIGYEYTSKSKAVSISTGPDKTGKVYQLTMPDTLELPNTVDEYVLMYFQSTGSRGVTSLVGMSEPFRAESRVQSSSASSAGSEVDKVD